MKQLWTTSSPEAAVQPEMGLKAAWLVGGCGSKINQPVNQSAYERQGQMHLGKVRKPCGLGFGEQSPVGSRCRLGCCGTCWCLPGSAVALGHLGTRRQRDQALAAPTQVSNVSLCWFFFELLVFASYHWPCALNITSAVSPSLFCLYQHYWKFWGQSPVEALLRRANRRFPG